MINSASTASAVNPVFSHSRYFMRESLRAAAGGGKKNQLFCDCIWPVISRASSMACRADSPPASHHNATAPCEPVSRAAPESRGECRDGSCELISEKTHVYEVAHRPRLLPFI